MLSCYTRVCGYLLQHASKAAAHVDQLAKRLLHDTRKVQKAQRVTRWCRVKNDDREFEALYELHDVRKAHRFVNAWNAA